MTKTCLLLASCLVAGLPAPLLAQRPWGRGQGTECDGDVGLRIPAQPAGAADYDRKGCTRKDEVSCVRLATLQSLGRGVPRDAPAAVRVLEAACKNDIQEGCFRLGVHLSSTKSPPDLSRAREVLDASCKADFAESCAWLKKLPPG